ncbi:RCC1 repeat-containing protein [Fulvia fulva]|uniref:RCC1 repeat-containing protein n=1 Tax=Passalora fulva TaxID=5499 RepID=A0A9Q8PDG8_PASFU|nr:RCC1 repeat-containing protein [Fulvia fulva]KAK4619632.1 RCC1 repeat-containing protein [Fulvia fulva]KAK4620447.1 RCC1 repeat-containing protein [Fulvia fulva]UJO20392.1 RCC1 repeat-containing protein [Fulvia fulva]WPV17393.1 RCC1 repeat-containing protein [Fulvia fulva]WPV32441.1 RCC1 repeat-containing protein [Fulvia fulva]
MASNKHNDIKIYAFGSNGSGQLGIGHSDDVSKSEPVVYAFHSNVTTTGETDANVQTIACGGNHSVMLLSDGSLWTSGDNSNGRCMMQVDGNGTAWHRQVDLRPVKHIAATWNATFFVHTDDATQVFVAGSGNTGELGLGQGITITSTVASMRLPPGQNIVKMTAGMGHIVVVTEQGEVWGWGKGRNGQLGKPAENVWVPRKIEGVPWPAVDVVCGKDFTCVFSDTSTQECLVLGVDRNDRFGVKATAPVKVPRWKQVGASWGSIFVLSESGQLTGWGRNDHGQLPPPDLPPLQSFAAGSEHCLGRTVDGKVLAWGWGEHGNCGDRTDPNGDVKGRYNEVHMPQSACAVFAGCATSFPVTEKQETSAVK